MKSMKKFIAVICITLLLTTPLVAFPDEQQQGSTVIEKSDTSTDTQKGAVPDTQIAPQPAPQSDVQVPTPPVEQPTPSPDK